MTELTTQEMTDICLKQINYMNIKVPDMNRVTVAAIYLNGSRMRKQNQPDSDYDLTVIVNPSIKSLFYHDTFISKQKQFITKIRNTEYEFDLKIYEKAQFAKLINKCNPTLTEQLLYKPIYVKNDPTNQQLFTVLKDLNPFDINPAKAFNAFRGMIFQEEHASNHSNEKRERNIKNYLNLIYTYMKKYVTNDIPENINLDKTQDPEAQLLVWQEKVLPYITVQQSVINMIEHAFIADFIEFCQHLQKS